MIKYKFILEENKSDCLFSNFIFVKHLNTKILKIHSFGKMNILMYLLEKHPEKPWSWYGISRNPNMTMEFIENTHR